MLEEIRALGFESVELSHGIRITLVPGILRAVEEGIVRISSTHNFCPLPMGVTQAAPNLFEPSSANEREREQWLRHSKRSIDFAAQVRAPVIVCHLGSIKFSWLNPARKVRKYLREHPDAGRARDDASYQALLSKSLMKVRKQQPPFWTRVVANVRELIEHARAKGVKLGFENREKFEELPLDDDFAEFLDSLPADAPVGYWHDTGHAELKERMGLRPQRVQLEQLARRTIGFHLHDVSADGRDHQPVGSGQIDFDMVSGFWRPEHVLTLELSPRATVDDIRVSKQRIEARVK
jgi:sugar phosphate isomerase/epimerase